MVRDWSGVVQGSQEAKQRVPVVRQLVGRILGHLSVRIPSLNIRGFWYSQRCPGNHQRDTVAADLELKNEKKT